MVRILHTADWQLGKQLENLGAPSDKLAFLRQGRIDVVRQIGQLTVERSVDTISVAGNMFERNEVSDLLIREVLAAMRRVSVPWLLLPGNYDPAQDQPASGIGSRGSGAQSMSMSCFPRNRSFWLAVGWLSYWRC